MKQLRKTCRLPKNHETKTTKNANPFDDDGGDDNADIFISFHIFSIWLLLASIIRKKVHQMDLSII